MLGQAIIEQAKYIIARLCGDAPVSFLDAQLLAAHFNYLKRVEARYQVARIIMTFLFRAARTTAIENLHASRRIEAEQGAQKIVGGERNFARGYNRLRVDG